MEKHFARDIASTISELSKSYAVIILTGPRQVGKTTVFKDLSAARNYVTLDDLVERNLAKSDPRMFLQLHPAPVLVDEVQHAPELFSYIKMAVDEGAAPGSFWLTGSQAFRMMELAQESLAGRAALLHLTTLSQHEIAGQGALAEFSVDLKALKARQNASKPADVKEMFERIWLGGMPGYASGKFPNRDVFFSSYLQTYLERDIRDLAPKVDSMAFADFIRAAACRCGDMLNIAGIARDVGVSLPTATRWLKLLEHSDVVYFLYPYSNNLLKRTVKAPKMYFFDTGLVAYLTRYSSPEILANGAINGNIFENYVINQIRDSYRNFGKDCQLWYYRDFDQAEIDIILEADGMLHPLEIKKTTSPTASMTKHFDKLRKGSVPVGAGAVICNALALSAIDSETFIVPVWAM